MEKVNNTKVICSQCKTEKLLRNMYYGEICIECTMENDFNNQKDKNGKSNCSINKQQPRLLCL